MVSTKTRLILFFVAKDREALYSQQKIRPGIDCGSDHELLIAEFKHKLKKVGETTRPFSYCWCCWVPQSGLSLWPHGRQASLSFTVSQSLLKLMCIELGMTCNHHIPLSPFSSCLRSFPASGFFANESVLCIRWPKYWSFNFSISPSNEYSGLITFRID